MRGEYSNSYANVDADRYTGYVQLVGRAELAYGFG
jgi:hypothetical protein